VISNVIFEMGDDEAVILTRAIHDPFKHVSISLSLVRDQGCSQDGVLEPDRRLR
jgi:hypothetical protein